MDFLTASDNRHGGAKVDPGDGGDAPETSYSVDPGDKYNSIRQTLTASKRSGNGLITSNVVTSSTFLNVDSNRFSCNGLTFSSRLTLALPDGPHDGALASVDDRIAMGFKITQPVRVRLQSNIVSDVDVAFIRLIGPAGTPLNVEDRSDQYIQLATAGVYTLIGSARLAVHCPNHSLGGRPLDVQLSATLTKG